MIGKVSPHGQRVTGLIYYLFGPGRQAEHTDPHIVAGWRHPAELEPRYATTASANCLTACSSSPRRARAHGAPRPVWHCSVRTAPDDRILSDDEWAQVACDIMHRTGLAPYGQEDDAVRWIAVRHAPDHIHLVAMLARQDGTRPQTWNPRSRSTKLMSSNRWSRLRARFRAFCTVHPPVGLAVTPPKCIRRVPCSMNTSTYRRLQNTVSACRKSTARIPEAWACRNCRQAGPERCGAGSRPAACRISQTVDGATAMPSFTSSPWIRR